MYNPLIKGRWYRFFIESDSSNVVLTESDMEDATVTNTAIHIPNNYKVKNVVYDIAVDGGSSTSLCIKSGSSGWNVSIPDKTGFTDGYVYVYAEKLL